MANDNAGEGVIPFGLANFPASAQDTAAAFGGLASVAICPKLTTSVGLQAILPRVQRPRRRRTPLWGAFGETGVPLSVLSDSVVRRSLRGSWSATSDASRASLFGSAKGGLGGRQSLCESMVASSNHMAAL